MTNNLKEKKYGVLFSQMEIFPYTYYILPLGGKLPTFGEVRLAAEKLINQNSPTAVSIKITCSQPADDKTYFVWHSPEIEDAWIALYDVNQKYIDGESFNCDHLSYYPGAEEIIIESGLLTPAQVIQMKERGYFFWSCKPEKDIVGTDIMQIGIRQIIYSIAHLSNGIIFSVNDKWDLNIHPATAEKFLTGFEK